MGFFILRIFDTIVLAWQLGEDAWITKLGSWTKINEY